MTLKIDLGEDRNYVPVDPKMNAKKQMSPSLMMDELSRSPEAALIEAHEASWINWINAEPLLTGYVDEEGNSFLFAISETIKNKAILLNVWDYTVLPSIRNLVYLKEWNRRYQASGLVTVGVHAPMFEFAKDKKNVLDAVHALGITYPVVLDNDYSIWRSVENRYWPRQVLFDSNWKICHDTVGEGDYENFERSIQKVLRGLNPGLACPPILKQKALLDERGTTIFFGQKRQVKFGNAQEFPADGDVTFFNDESAGSYVPGVPYLEGFWSQSSEFIRHSTGTAKTPYKGPIRVTLKFTGKNVYILAKSHTRNSGDVPQMIRVKVSLNNKPVREDYAGRNLTVNEAHQSQMSFREPHLYQILKGLEPGYHELTLIIDSDAADSFELYGIYLEEA